jgi:hypothetical protein
MPAPETTTGAPRQRTKYVPAVGPRLTWLLWLVMGLFAVIAVNARDRAEFGVAVAADARDRWT